MWLKHIWIMSTSYQITHRSQVAHSREVCWRPWHQGWLSLPALPLQQSSRTSCTSPVLKWQMSPVSHLLVWHWATGPFVNRHCFGPRITSSTHSKMPFSYMKIWNMRKSGLCFIYCSFFQEARVERGAWIQSLKYEIAQQYFMSCAVMLMGSQLLG